MVLLNEDIFNCDGIAIPPRSILHHLRLEGFRSPYIESLTSHVMRLAESHCLSTGVLMEQKFAPLMGKAYGGAHLNKIYKHVSALNGIGSMTSDLVKALEHQTLHKYLQFLTMLPWSEVFPTRGLLRANRVWCPVCYEEWHNTKAVVYEPLLWTLRIVEVCPIHQQVLKSTCPFCNEENLPLSWRSRSGHCFKCEKWLGGSSSTFSAGDKSYSETELEWLVWAANSVGELLAVAPSLTFKPPQDRVAKGLNTCVQSFTSGNVAEFARLIQTPKNTVWLWCNGKNLPQLDTLVKLCFRLKISVLDLLTKGEFEITTDSTRLLPNSLSLSKSRAEVKFTNPDQVHSQLAAVLLDHELPPASLEATARALGHHRETLYRNFEDLCRAISAKYDQYEQMRYLKSIEECCSEVRRVVIQLHEQGIYPSEARVSQYLAKPGHLRYKQVRTVLQETRKSLGLRR